ncbi:glycosyltransferase family A protein [Chishuiella changwenlii]|uniref:glycosyltransferase family 2 protein n=1 Tax=Chishuiella changwenlii TaxID=1434701 RepID=UPI002FDA9550
MSTLITIFTPAYNRAHLLPRLYKSLKNLNNKKFEWIIIDDGSKDDTKHIVDDFIIETKDFPIYYFYQENQGKHIAINHGLEKAKGELFFIVDSDDFLPSNSLDILQKYYPIIENDNELVSLVGRINFENKENKDFPFDNLIMTSFDANKNYKLEDVAEVYKTNILKQYKFPKFKGEKFCTEALVWNRISKRYKQYYFNEIIYNREYQEGGLTSNYWNLLLNNPKGSLLYFKELLQFSLNKSQKKQTLKAYNNIAKVNGYSKFKIIQELGLINFIKIYL